MGKIPVPDIISVRHLHMHVIVETYAASKFVKYNSWAPWFYIEVEDVLKRLRSQQNEGEENVKVAAKGETEREL